MTIRFSCRCGKKLKTSDDKIGKKILCPDCGSPVIVPERSTAKVEAVSAGAADMASDLLRSSATESRKARRDAEFELAPRKELISLETVDAFRQIAFTIVPAVAFIAVVCLGTYWLSSQVLKGGAALPELAKVHGLVYFNGAPLAGASITFQPEVPPNSGVKIAASEGRTDAAGHFTLTYVRDVEGAAVGPHKVFIYAADENGRELVPAKYNVRTTLVREVKPDSKEFNFDLSSAETEETPGQQ